MDLDGKVIAVTGANGRLGQRIVQGFGQQGATVAAIVRDQAAADALSFPGGVDARPFAADLTDEGEVEACFGRIGRVCGRLDVLVHTAGGWAMKPLLETSLAEWRGLMQLNLDTAFLCFREAARLMQGHEGRLIGISAAQGADGGRAKQGAYSASKAGVVRLVEAVAQELSGTGITAHAIVPSTILYDDPDGKSGVSAAHLVALCLYLCSEAGAAHNGAALRAYGG
jgi:3-oxoacyl-[acyl-carrier protein] reductase